MKSTQTFTIRLAENGALVSEDEFKVIAITIIRKTMHLAIQYLYK